jgi:hypothetical protein
MYAHQVLDKMKAEQSGKVPYPTDAPQSTAGCCRGDDNMGSVLGQAQEEPLIWRLRREAMSYGEQTEKKNRAVEILERHPEFEELIELLRLVPIY